jgi:type II secretory pathway component PulK
MRFTRSRNDHGVALITVLMLLALISAMLVATTTLVVKDQRSRFQDQNRTDTFYVAHAGLEKITNDLGRAFAINWET